MADSLHQIEIHTDAHTLYQAINSDSGIKSWWTPLCHMAQKEGDNCRISYESLRLILFAQKLLPQKRAFWVCLDGPQDWLGTELWWEIEQLGPKLCRLDFKHMNWQRDDGLFPQANSMWGNLLNKLKDYCECQAIPEPIHRPLMEAIS